MATIVGVADQIYGAYPVRMVTLTELVVSTGDVVTYPVSQRNMLIVDNTSAGSATIVIVGGIDPLGRTKNNIMVVPAGEMKCSPVLYAGFGWAQSDGLYHVTGGVTGVKLTMLTLP